MLKKTALFATLALASSASIALASPSYRSAGYDRSHDRAPGVVVRTRIQRPAEARLAVEVRDRGWTRDARIVAPSWRRAAIDDLGPRHYRPTWVALDAPQPLIRGQECIEVSDPGTFTQLRLQSNAGVADIDRVIVEFADGSQQVADLDRALDQPGEFVELPLDGNNRRIERIIVTGATARHGDLQVFGI